VILVSAPETTDAAGTPAQMPAWPTARTMTAIAVLLTFASGAVSTRIDWHLAGKRSAGPQPKPPGGYWPAHMTVTLLAEIALFCGVVVGWGTG
jgi:hypothetical protein